MLSKIEWSANFSVGNEKLDEQHRLIINYINQLIELHDTSTHSEHFHDILVKLIHYSQAHLYFEEQVLHLYDYPNFETHKTSHDQYSEAVAIFSLDTLLRDDTLIKKTLLYLKIWWQNHILIEDMEYKNFLANKSLS